MTAGTLSLVHLTSGPGSTGIGAKEDLGPALPDPSASAGPGADGTGGTDAKDDTNGTGGDTAPTPLATPRSSPSSPTALGGQGAPLRVPVVPGGAVAPTVGAPPRTTHTPGTPSNAPPPPPPARGTPSGNSAPPPPANDAPSPPADHTPARPAPPPPDHREPSLPPPPARPGEPDHDAPVLCVPVIGLCVGGDPFLRELTRP